MAESIVKVPNDTNMDYDYIAFSFMGKHSYEDFGIIRTSDGNRYNYDLNPNLTEKTADVPNGDGMYYFGTHHKQKNFPISFAFDNLSEEKLGKLKGWLNGKDFGDLWFAEAPYKVYTAKVTGRATIKAIPFEINGQRVYKGEGSVTFTAYWPYAHTPSKIQRQDGTLLSGNEIASYEDFPNYRQFQSLINYGDLEFPFVAYLDEVSGEITSSLSVLQNGTEISLSIQSDSLDANNLNITDEGLLEIKEVRNE